MRRHRAAAAFAALCAGAAHAAAFAALCAGAAHAAAPDVPDVPPFGLGAFDRDEPISITADELVAKDDDGRRSLAFRRNVEVRQGALRLSAQVLEARYAAGEKQPDELRARGAVRIREGTRRAHCAEAHYDRLARRIVCRGAPARLWDGEDQLSGGVVAFDLERQAVHVERGAALEIHRDVAEAVRSDAGDPLGLEGEGEALLERVREGGPIAITADSLDAADAGDRRRISFRGDVHLRQQDVELRSGELEVLYPPAATRPDRLIAREDVVIREGEREARCEHAEYLPDARLVTCQGRARLRDGDDRLEGDRIRFDLDAQRVDAEGQARLWVDPTRRGRRLR